MDIVRLLEGVVVQASYLSCTRASLFRRELGTELVLIIMRRSICRQHIARFLVVVLSGVRRLRGLADVQVRFHE